MPALVIAGAIAVIIAGCSSSPNPTDQASTTQPASPLAPQTAKAGSELWADNCTRCHNVRPPDYYSDAQGDVIVHHMRLRANLTGQEARAIAQFLKASN
jgi:hypothetical protein